MHKIVLCILILTVLSCGYAQGDRFKLCDQLPDRTLLLWHFPDIAKSRDAMMGTSLHQLLQEPEVQGFFRTTIEPYKGYVEGALGQVGDIMQMPLEEAIQILTGELAIAVVDVNLKQKSVGVVVALEFGENRMQIQHLLGMAKKNIGITFSTEQYNGHDIYVANGTPPNMTVSYAMVNGSLLVSSQKQLLHEIISGPEGLNKKLTDTESFKEVNAKVHRHGVPVESLYLNIEEASKRFSFAIPRDVMGILNQLQVFNAKAWGMGINIDNSYINLESFLYCPGKKEGAWSFFDAKPLSSDIASKAPKHSNGFAAARLDFSGQLNNIKALLEDLSPDGSFMKTYEQIKREIDRELEFSIEQALEIFNTEFYSYNYMPQEGGMLPRTISVVELKNTEKFWQFLEKLNKYGAELKTTSFGDNTIYYLSQSLGKIKGDPFRRIEKLLEQVGGFSGIGFIVENNTLYVGGTVHDLKSFLEERNSWEGFDQNASFQEVAKFIPENASLIWYVDFRELFNEFWNTITPVLRSFEGIMRAAGIPFDSAHLPQATTISKHLKPALFSYAADDKGFHVTYTSSMTFILPFLGTVGVGSAIIVPIIEQQVTKAKEQNTLYTLKNITTVQQMYKMNVGKYATLGELIDDGYLSYGLFRESEGLYSYGEDYYFYMYFAGESTAVTEAEFLESGLDTARYIIYAVPNSYSKAQKIYASDQTGKTVCLEGRQYDRWYLPQANAAFSENSENADNLDGEMAADAIGKDGNYWMTVY